MIASASNHAVARWCERFPGEDIQAAFGRAELVPAGKLIGLREACGKPGLTVKPNCQYFRDPVTAALFVVATDQNGCRCGMTVTTLPLPETKRRPLWASG